MKNLRYRTRLALGIAVALVASVAALAAAPLSRADSFVISSSYVVEKPGITCETDFNGAGYVTSKEVDLNTFTMYSPRYNQKVSYIATLWQWTSNGWANPVSLPEQFGNTSGVLSSGYHFNVPAATTSYYAVSVVFRYWWNGAVEKSANLWAGTHLMFFMQDFGNGTFSTQYGDSGSWCHMNVNQAV